MRVKLVILISILTFLISCQTKDDGFDCYLDQFPEEHRKHIVELHQEFKDFLVDQYPESKNVSQQFKAYCTDLTSGTGYRENVTDDFAKKVKRTYYEASLDTYFRDWEKHTYNIFTGKHFVALDHCMEYDTRDSLIYHYLKTYREAGDLSPGYIFPRYIANEAEEDILENRFVHHIFILEFFAGRMMSMVE